jgi:hypothetical protein
MGLRDIAAADFGIFVNDDVTGWGWAATVVDPAGTSVPLKVFSNDIFELIDNDTGVVVSGRNASATMVLADLTAAGLGMPEAIAAGSSKPWTVTFDDINSQSYTFKIADVRPDRTIGSIVCLLEEYSA